MDKERIDKRLNELCAKYQAEGEVFPRGEAGYRRILEIRDEAIKQLEGEPVEKI